MSTKVKAKNKRQANQHVQAMVRQRQARLETVTELFLQNYTYAEIGKRVGVSAKTICLDIKELHEGWVEANKRNTDQYVQAELARIAKIERTAWEQWERSLTNRATVVKVEKALRPVVKGKGKPKNKDGRRTEQPPGGDEDLTVEMRMQTVKRLTEARRTGMGDPIWLDRVAWCVETRAKLLGLTRPDVHLTKTDVTVNNNTGPSWDDLHSGPEAADPVGERLALVEALPAVREPISVETTK